jgi:hypothetical protein
MRSLLLVALAACGPAGVARTTPPTVASREAPPAPPAAGVYWVPYMTCHDCEQPTALASYVVDDIAHARTIAKQLEGTLPLGFPFVVHAEEVGIDRDAILIVVGTYVRRADAEAATQVAPAIPRERSMGDWRAEVVQLPADNMIGQAERQIVRIDRGPRVSAWSRADVEQVENEADESSDPAVRKSQASRRAWVLERLRARKAACTVGPGDMFLAETSELRWYEFAPVRCGDAPAYVVWTSSLLGHAAIVRDGTGYRLHQVVGAMCDSPIIESWRYDERGRLPARDESDAPVRVAGC